MVFNIFWFSLLSFCMLVKVPLMLTLQGLSVYFEMVFQSMCLCTSMHVCRGVGRRVVPLFSVPPHPIKETYVIFFFPSLEPGGILKLSVNKRKPAQMKASFVKNYSKNMAFWSSGISCPVCLKDASLSWKFLNCI